MDYLHSVICLDYYKADLGYSENEKPHLSAGGANYMDLCDEGV